MRAEWLRGSGQRCRSPCPRLRLPWSHVHRHCPCPPLAIVRRRRSTQAFKNRPLRMKIPARMQCRVQSCRPKLRSHPKPAPVARPKPQPIPMWPQPSQLTRNPTPGFPPIQNYSRSGPPPCRTGPKQPFPPRPPANPRRTCRPPARPRWLQLRPLRNQTCRLFPAQRRLLPGPASLPGAARQWLRPARYRCRYRPPLPRFQPE